MNKPGGHIKETNLQLIVSFHRSDTDVTEYSKRQPVKTSDPM